MYESQVSVVMERGAWEALVSRGTYIASLIRSQVITVTPYQTGNVITLIHLDTIGNLEKVAAYFAALTPDEVDREPGLYGFVVNFTAIGGSILPVRSMALNQDHMIKMRYKWVICQYTKYLLNTRLDQTIESVRSQYKFLMEWADQEYNPR